MPIPSSPLNLTPANVAAVNAALDTILTTLLGAGVVNLTESERKSMKTIGDTRQPYVDQGLTPSISPQNPSTSGCLYRHILCSTFIS
jgi:hypothetical protein